MNPHGRHGTAGGGAQDSAVNHAICRKRAAPGILGPHCCTEDAPWKRCPPDAVCPDQPSGASRCSSSSLLMLTAVFGLLLLSLIHLGQESGQPGGGAAGELCPTVLLLRCAVYLGGAVCALVAGSLCALHCAGRQAALPDFTRARTPTQVFHSMNLNEPAQLRRVVICHSMDKALKEVFDYSYRDYIMSWYGELGKDDGQLYHLLSEDFWELTRQLRCRLAHIDIVKVVCNDVVKNLLTHFCDLKAANTR